MYCVSIYYVYICVCNVSIYLLPAPFLGVILNAYCGIYRAVFRYSYIEYFIL